MTCSSGIFLGIRGLNHTIGEDQNSGSGNMLFGMTAKGFFKSKYWYEPGVQKVRTAGTAGFRHTHVGWTKRDLDEQTIGHIIKRAKTLNPTLTNLTIKRFNHLSNK